MRIYKSFVVVIFALAIYIINANTPLMWEDIIYTLKADRMLATAMNDASITHCSQLSDYETVSDFGGLIESTYYHYNYANGRLFPHLTSQIFGSMVGKPVFNVLNTFMLFLLAYVLSLFAVTDKKFLFYYWCVVFFCIWYFMHQTNACYFLMTYALNYLWSSVFCLIFLYIYMYKIHFVNSRWKQIFFCIFAFGAGWSHEGLAVGIAGALFIDCIIRWRLGRLEKKKIFSAICFCLGTVFLCLAPSNFCRAGVDWPLYNRLLPFARLRIFYVMIIVFLLLSRSLRFIIANRIIIMSLVIQMAFMFYVAYRNPRVLWGTELYSLLLILLILAKNKNWVRALPCVALTVSILLMLHLGCLVFASNTIRRQFDAVIQLYKASPSGEVIYNVQAMPAVVSDYIQTPLCEDRYFERMTYSVYYSKGTKELIINDK